MDYDVQMLKLYFKEKNFSLEEIESLLNDNPFNKDYVIWLNQSNSNGKTLAFELKNLIQRNTNIQEFVTHNNDSIGKYLANNVNISLYQDSVKVLPSHLVLMRGKNEKQSSLIKRLSNNNIPFVIGECTKDKLYYEYIRNYYIKLKKEFNCSFIETNNYNQNMCIIKSK